MADSEILLYQTEDGQTKIDVRLEDETVWLSQVQMAELFQTTKQNISLHINNIFDEGELQEISTVKDYLTVQTEGKREVQRNLKIYNLDVIISVGYRVKSHRGTQFRIWATTQLREYLIVDQYLSFAELQARNRKPMYMNDWINKLNDFMTLNDKEILEHAGRISAKMAKELAESEYEKYRKNRIEIEDAHEMKKLEEGLRRLENKKK